jgi:putative membrane protein
MLKRSLALAAVLCVAAGCGSESTEQLGGMASPQLSSQDNTFFRNITEGNLTEIQSSHLALQMAKSPDVKDFAQQMISDHQTAATQVDAIAKSKGAVLPKMLDGSHKDMVDALNGKSGDDFDKAYIDLQIKAHQETINLDQDEADNGTDPDVKSTAAGLLPILKHHLNMAQQIQTKMMGM